MKLLRLCLRELAHHPRFVLIFLLNASIGLVGLMTVENFKTTFNNVLESRSRMLLGADISLRSRQEIPPEEVSKVRSKLPDGTQEAHVLSLFSMASGETHSRLVSVRAIEPHFPFYGQIIFSDGTKHPNENGFFLGDDEVWVYPELAMVLDISLGEEIKIGNHTYKIAKLIEEDSQQAFQEGAMAPRLYMSKEGLERAGLVGERSRYSERFYFKLPEGEFDVEKIGIELNRDIIDPSVSISTPKDSSEQVGRTLNYLNDFLGLVSLVALFLSSVGLFYLYRSYLHRRREDMAILSCLGFSQKNILKLYIIHLLVLGLLGVLLTWVISSLFFPILSGLLAQVLPFKMPAFAGARPYVLSLIVGVGGNLFLALPLLRPILSVRANAVFQNLEAYGSDRFSQMLLLGLPWLVFYWSLSVVMSKSLIIGSSFVAVFIGVSLIIFPLGSMVLNYFTDKGNGLPLSLKLTLRTLCRFKLSTLSLFLSLVLATLLMTMIPTIERNLQQEISHPGESSLPSFFMFDIQEDQVDRLHEIAGSYGVSLRGISPMIISRLMSINDEPFVRELNRALTREEEREFRIRNRGVNLTYRDIRDDSEKLVRGRDFTGLYDWESGKPAEITVEERYAERMNIKLGDKLVFDVLDMPIEAIVVGIRQVRWTSFMPNFFIVFQPGVLNDAPKSFLGVVPGLEREIRHQLQRSIVNELSNVSLIDVGQLIERIMKIMEQMSWALKTMAFLSLGVGLFVLFSLAQHQMSQREKDVALLKILGLSFERLRLMVRLEFLILGFLASLIGSLISIFVTWGFALLFFDGIWTFDPLAIVIAIFTVTFLCVLISEIACRRGLSKSAQSFLQQAL